MRVAVFAHSLRDAGGRSVGMNLMEALPRVDPAVEWLFVVPPGRGYERAAPAPNVELVTSPRVRRMRRAWWELTAAPRLAASWRADWALALGNLPLLRGATRKAVLVHDPHLFYPPGELGHLTARTRVRKTLARLYLRIALPRQDVVFAQTTVAADRIAAMYRLDPSRIVVVPNALSARITPPDRTAARAALGLPPADFTFLTLTKYAGRKGLETIVTMFERYRELLGDTLAVLTVDVTAGGGARALMRRVAAARLGDRIVNLGPVDQRDLGALYAQVDAVVLPSLLESYSGVYVEAMAFGVPIITSDRDFARVVCGDAAVYVEPTDPAAIARAVADLAAAEDKRRELAAAGVARVRRLGADWQDSAAAIHEAMAGYARRG